MNQYTREDLKTMTPAEIVAAHDAGHLHVLMGGNQDEADALRLVQTGNPISSDIVTRLRSMGRNDLIVEAHTRGLISQNPNQE